MFYLRAPREKRIVALYRHNEKPQQLCSSLRHACSKSEHVVFSSRFPFLRPDQNRKHLTNRCMFSFVSTKLYAQCACTSSQLCNHTLLETRQWRVQVYTYKRFTRFLHLFFVDTENALGTCTSLSISQRRDFDLLVFRIMLPYGSETRFHVYIRHFELTILERLLSTKLSFFSYI